LGDAPAYGEPRAGGAQVNAEAEPAAVPERPPRVRLEPGRKLATSVGAAGDGRRYGAGRLGPPAAWRAQGKNSGERHRRHRLRGCHGGAAERNGAAMRPALFYLFG
jgi:hypothetical protein